MFLSAADFLSKLTFSINFSEIPSGCQTVWIRIRPDVLSGLICVQTVCEVYQQMTVQQRVKLCFFLSWLILESSLLLLFLIVMFVVVVTMLLLLLLLLSLVEVMVLW